MDNIKDRVRNYWTKRAHDFNIVRRNELKNEYAMPWIEVFKRYIPENKGLRILDVGTGTGYFAILLGRLGHRVTGIDFTEAMIEEAKRNSIDFYAEAEFIQMDAQELKFQDEVFDVIISRNLTWTLPEPRKAYKEWYRVLKKGGILLNFDANYAVNVRNKNQKESYIKDDEAYGHIGVTEELEKENAEITLEMGISNEIRPNWDIITLKDIGFTQVNANIEIGKTVLSGHDLEDAPMFLVYAKK